MPTCLLVTLQWGSSMQTAALGIVQHVSLITTEKYMHVTSADTHMSVCLCLHSFITSHAYVFKSDFLLYILHPTRNTFDADAAPSMGAT